MSLDLPLLWRKQCTDILQLAKKASCVARTRMRIGHITSYWRPAARAQVISIPPLGPGDAAGAEVPVTQNPAMSNPAANPATIQVHFTTQDRQASRMLTTSL